MESNIEARIEQIQKGRSGIYPWWVGQQIAAEFGIKVEEAMPFVMSHIKKVSEEATK